MLKNSEDCLKLALDSYAQAPKPNLGLSLPRYLGYACLPSLAGFSVWEKCKEMSLWVKPIPGYPESLEQRAEALKALAGHRQF